MDRKLQTDMDKCRDIGAEYKYKNVINSNQLP